MGNYYLLFIFNIRNKVYIKIGVLREMSREMYL